MQLFLYREEVSNKIHELRHRMEEQMSSRRELEAQLHSKETQKMEEFRSKVNYTQNIISLFICMLAIVCEVQIH